MKNSGIEIGNSLKTPYLKIVLKESNQTILDLIEKYAKKHDTALSCGAEYIYQDDDAQVDALELVSDIFDYISEIYEEEDD